MEILVICCPVSARARAAYIQRQQYVATCIAKKFIPSGNPAKREKLPPALAKRMRREEPELYEAATAH